MCVEVACVTDPNYLKSDKMRMRQNFQAFSFIICNQI